MLREDIQKKYTSVSLDPFLQNNNIKLNQAQYDSLVSFTYNVGEYIWNKPTSDFTQRSRSFSCCGLLKYSKYLCPEFGLKNDDGVVYYEYN